MLKLTKILYENAQEKFKNVNRVCHDAITNALDETEIILRKNEKTIK